MVFDSLSIRPRLIYSVVYLLLVIFLTNYYMSGWLTSVGYWLTSVGYCVPAW